MSHKELPFELNEVLIHKRSRELYHVQNRVQDVDDETVFYRLQDDTHTTQEWWYLEDMQDCFISTGEVVSGKPRQNIMEWYE